MNGNKPVEVLSDEKISKRIAALELIKEKMKVSVCSIFGFGGVIFGATLGGVLGVVVSALFAGVFCVYFVQAFFGIKNLKEKYNLVI